MVIARRRLYIILINRGCTFGFLITFSSPLTFARDMHSENSNIFLFLMKYFIHDDNADVL